MNACVVNVATGSYLKGQKRLAAVCEAQGVQGSYWRDMVPSGAPSHTDVPYAFKAYALHDVEVTRGCDVLLWCDASILPIAPLQPLFAKIEREGVWLARNGWTNYQWTANEAYGILLPEYSLNDARAVNGGIQHVVATAFGVDVRHPVGRAIFDDYFRFASETRAFCGPWINTAGNTPDKPPRYGNCGPEDVLGHRHDQTALSVLAWRYGVKLTEPPEIFAYKGGETDATILVADGGY